MSPFDVAAAIVVGLLSGVLSGMFGVGGAVVTTPGIRALGASPIEAVGSTLPAIIPGSISGSWRYHREGLVEWRTALTCGLVGSSFAVAGGELSDHVNAHYLMLVTAALVLYTGLRNIADARAAAAVAERQREAAVVPSAPAPAVTAPAAPPTRTTSLAVIAVIGAAAGLLAGLLGVGGGILMVPAFTAILRMPPKQAVGTSLVGVAIFSVPATITHMLLGHIHWGYALCLVVGVVPGAQLGARYTITGSERRLRLLMGTFFTVIAVVYAVAEIRSM